MKQELFWEVLAEAPSRFGVIRDSDRHQPKKKTLFMSESAPTFVEALFCGCEVKMGQIENTISVYEGLKGKKYKITIENGDEVVFGFGAEHYHHLAGYHYLTDISGIARPQYGTKRFYQQMKRGQIKTNQITGSSHFAYIKDRIDNFGLLDEIVSPGRARVIVHFDKAKAGSKIDAEYFLYKRAGDPLNKEPVTYYMLFLGYDSYHSEYYPATYVVEPSNKYVSGQIFLNCTIECLDSEVGTKKRETSFAGQA